MQALDGRLISEASENKEIFCKPGKSKQIMYMGSEYEPRTHDTRDVHAFGLTRWYNGRSLRTVHVL